MLTRRPLCASFEITHNCTANCRHCDKGAVIDDNQVSAAEYRRICDELNPVLVQVAGGEPLKREDLPEIIRALHRPGKPPMIALISNASLLTVDKYLILREAGVHQFSISIDFPDSRHDENRRIPGLFDHLSELMPSLIALGHGDVVMNCCMTRENYSEIAEIAKLTNGWGVKLNFSTYTSLRTGNTDLNLRHPEDTRLLSGIIDEIYSGKPEYANVMTSERVMRRYSAFYETCEVPDCKAGYRFLVINPDGLLTPCAMHIDERYTTRGELIERFTRQNTCGGCYISSRANTEKSVWELLTDNLRFARLSRKSRDRKSA
jgi:MoaA/NifB/PqqE/SkfB family radical SAM enzyme